MLTASALCCGTRRFLGFLGWHCCLVNGWGMSAFWGCLAHGAWLVGGTSVTCVCPMPPVHTHLYTCVYTSVHACTWESCMCQCWRAHEACASQVSTCTHPAHMWAHTEHSHAHVCAVCVHPHLMPAAVCPSALGVFAPSCVLVCIHVLLLAHVMADAQALFPLPCCCCGD